MTEILKVNNEILENPRNYAAIYARVSSAKDNNSIKAQIEKAKSILNKRNLLVYGAYTDHVSGLTTPPAERAGFSKLLADAKSGRFKTFIAYKHDRIVRNLKDWIEIKNQFKKLGIKIIFSDETEYASDDSLQGDFLENLLVMVAELEPGNINERSSNGRDFRRNQGVYNSARSEPFAYKRETFSSVYNPSNIKSFYKVDPLKAAFIEYIFNSFSSSLDIEDNKTSLRHLKKDTLEILDNVSKNLSVTNLNNLEKGYSCSIKSKFISAIKQEIELGKPIQDIKEILIDINKRAENIAHIHNLLKNPIYGGYQLIDSNNESLGIIIEENSVRLNFSSFEKLINVEGPIVDKNVFEKVYCHLHLHTLLKHIEPAYMFKGMLKCGICNRKMYLYGHLFKCDDKKSQPNCKSYVKTNLIESILDMIIDDALIQSELGFNKFSNAIEEKLNRYNNELQKLRNLKISILKDYLKYKNEKYMEVINHKQREINELLQKVAELQERLHSIRTLQKNISLNYSYKKTSNEDDKSLIAIIKIHLIDYITQNENIFNPLFEKIIKTIEVKPIAYKDIHKSQISINYEYIYKEHSDISESIH